MRKIAVAVICAVLAGVFCLAGCLGRDPYDSAAGRYDGEQDGSVALISAENMPGLLNNPDRGLRMETYITLGDPLYSYPLNAEDPYVRVENMIEKYASDQPVLFQAYVYLTNYADKPLDDTALSQLKKYFELFRENNVKILLRFAYQTESVPDADYETMQEHIATLDKFFTDNSRLIKDTVYALQLGMIGYWGEGHSFVNFDWKSHSKDLVRDMCEFADNHGLYMQVRTMEIYSKVPLKYRDTVGMHDDYVIDDVNDPWAFLPANDGRYKRMMKKFAVTVNDGEMPWGDAKLGDKEDGASLNSMDGMTILKRIASNSMTSFSLEHNYREKEGATFSMYKWRSEYVTYEQCVSEGITVNKRLFDISGGKLSIYDVLRYHLGYQLVLSNYSRQGDEVTFTVTNYGFAAPLTQKYFALVTTENGQLCEHEIFAYDPVKLTSGETVRYRIRVPEGAEIAGVRLAADKDSIYSVRFANDTEFSQGVQKLA